MNNTVTLLDRKLYKTAWNLSLITIGYNLIEGLVSTYFTVSDKGWNSKKNGELLQLMLDEEFDVLLTFDRIFNISRTLRNTPLQFSFEDSGYF